MMAARMAGLRAEQMEASWVQKKVDLMVYCLVEMLVGLREKLRAG